MPFASEGGWFSRTAIAGYAHTIDTGELFADGLISRRELHAAKFLSGGPHNVFHLPAGVSRLTPSRISAQLALFVREFRLPTEDQLGALLQCVFGNPFRPVAFAPEWRTGTAVILAAQMYESRTFDAMPILADALQDAGCNNDDILDHCRDPKQIHVRGCWVVDLVLGKE
ncbi:hypothetical protein [Gemmata sp. SH-PL17]|uniref:hypothetical protein n=1 Tax=Gemmata sp. SH-PL17 TaxID=1630693 RepID=UPI001EF65815|nr:hypothetical protein [Gemmata sp. SH-PL17]